MKKKKGIKSHKPTEQERPKLDDPLDYERSAAKEEEDCLELKKFL